MSMQRKVHRLRPWVLALWLATLASPAVLLLAQGLEASLADVKGQVQVSRAGSSQYETADANTRLATGDRVRTLANSSARLAFFEGSTTDIAALTAVRIDDLSQTDTQSSIRLLQTGGVSEAQVQQAPDKSTSYQVESPAAVANASTQAATCPWVRVDADGTTLVRNYSASVRLRVEPQPVLELRWVPGFVPTPLGPIPQMMPQLVSVLKDMPVAERASEQPLIACPFGDQPVGALGEDYADGLADIDPAEAGSYRLASAEPAWPPLLGRLGLAAELARVEAQSLPYSITVHNTSGDIQTVRVSRGMESQIQVGQPPSQPASIGTFAAQSAAQAASANAMSQAQAASAQSQSQAAGAAAAAGQAAQSAAAGQALAQAALQQQLLNQLLNQTPPQSPPPPSSTGPVPCASRVGDQCTVTGQVHGASTVIPSGMSWSLSTSVPAGVSLGTVATARVTTTIGQEQFVCSPVGTTATTPVGLTSPGDRAGDEAAGGMRLLSIDGPGHHFGFSVFGQVTGITPTVPTTVVCNGTTVGLGLQNSTASIVFPSGTTQTGTVTGPGPR